LSIGETILITPDQPRFGVEEIADCFASLMSDVLGYKRFGAQGGDWGSFITSRLAFSYSNRLIGIHLNMMPLRRDPKMVARWKFSGVIIASASARCRAGRR
jgi:microsomal epoxide hydrolase